MILLYIFASYFFFILTVSYWPHIFYYRSYLFTWIFVFCNKPFTAIWKPKENLIFSTTRTFVFLFLTLYIYSSRKQKTVGTGCWFKSAILFASIGGIANNTFHPLLISCTISFKVDESKKSSRKKIDVKRFKGHIKQNYWNHEPIVLQMEEFCENINHFGMFLCLWWFDF